MEFNVFDDWLLKVVKKQLVSDTFYVGEVGSQDGPKMGPRGPKIDRYTNNNANININIVLNVINLKIDFDNLQTTDNK